MSNIQISLTQSRYMAKMTIQENCCFCDKLQKTDEPCIRLERNRKIICKSCLRSINYLNVISVISNPDQRELNFG